MAYTKQTWDTTSYVNPTRLNHIEDGIDDASKHSRRCVYYGTCSTSASTSAKVVSVSSAQGFELVTGVVVIVSFTQTNTSDTATLNVNSTGAISVYYNTSTSLSDNASKQAGGGYANRSSMYMYDGTYWVWISHGVDNNTTYSTMTAGEVATGTVTTAKLARADRLKTDIKTLILGNVQLLSTTETGYTITGRWEQTGRIVTCTGRMQATGNAETFSTNLPEWDDSTNLKYIPITMIRISDTDYQAFPTCYLYWNSSMNKVRISTDRKDKNTGAQISAGDRLAFSFSYIAKEAN